VFDEFGREVGKISTIVKMCGLLYINDEYTVYTVIEREIVSVCTKVLFSVKSSTIKKMGKTFPYV
jgi:hypothetical protein